MRDLSDSLRARAEWLRAEARITCGSGRLNRREVYLFSIAMQRAASMLDDEATKIEDEAEELTEGGDR